MTTAVQPVPLEGTVFRATHQAKGRQGFITPANSTMEHLCYGRIRLDAETPEVAFQNRSHETVLICLSGDATVELAGRGVRLGHYDSAYIPRGSTIRVRTESGADLVELSAEVGGAYPFQFVPYSEVKANPSLHFTTGGVGTRRTLNILVGKNVQAGRVMAGITISEPGCWTSWPPHEHAAMLEEMYVYTEMPAPAFGIQLVYTNSAQPEIMTLVREGDAVLMPRGYHPNVSAPGHRIAFLWAMAAHKEVEDRQFGVVNVHPDFSGGGGGGSGLEAARK